MRKGLKKETPRPLHGRGAVCFKDDQPGASGQGAMDISHC
jgi:hypothetical protein